MGNLKIRSIWENSYQDFLDQGSRPSFVQQKICTALSPAAALRRSIRFENQKKIFLSGPKSSVINNSYEWSGFRDNLYHKEWCAYSKETFNGFGNAIEYLGRYTHKVAISNSRILSVGDGIVTFSAHGREPGEPRRNITLDNTEFIRRYLMHVLPAGFQKIRYYGFRLRQFHQMKRILSPYTCRLPIHGLVQLERITFRAVYLLYKLLFFCCSESDTFLMNYSRKEGGRVAVYADKI